MHFFGYYYTAYVLYHKGVLAYLSFLMSSDTHDNFTTNFAQRDNLSAKKSYVYAARCNCSCSVVLNYLNRNHFVRLIFDAENTSCPAKVHMKCITKSASASKERDSTALLKLNGRLYPRVVSKPHACAVI